MGPIDPQPFRGKLMKQSGVLRPFRILYGYGEVSLCMEQQKILFTVLGCNGLDEKYWDPDVEFIIHRSQGGAVFEAEIIQEILFENVDWSGVTLNFFRPHSLYILMPWMISHEIFFVI